MSDQEAVFQVFISDVKQVLDDDGVTDAGLERIAGLMRQLTKNPTVTAAADDPTGNIHSGRQSAPLVIDEQSGLTLVRARFGPEAMTPIHSHGSWGVIGVYRGRDRYQIWRRLDDGLGPGDARVEMIDERILEPGDAVILPAPPQDIHAQQGHDGETTYEFVLFGKNTMVLPRLYFDPKSNSAREILPGER